MQIFYALSRISDDGETGVWKENWQTAKIASGNFGTFAVFIQEFKEAFTSITSVDDTMKKLKSLRMGSNSADEHTGKFNLLIDKAGMANAGAPVLIDFYQSSLAPWLIQLIYQGIVPTTLDDWKKKAILLDHNKWLAQSYIGGRSMYTPQKKKKAIYKFNHYAPSSSRDDDAIDVDRLAVTIQKLSFPE